MIDSRDLDLESKTWTWTWSLRTLLQVCSIGYNRIMFRSDYAAKPT